MRFLDQIRLFAKGDAQKTAIVDRDGERSASYAELDALSGRIAAKLAAAGFGEGSFIVLGLDRSMEYVAAYLGALKAGCAAVPVIRSYPPERIAYIRQDCGAGLLLDEAFLTDIEQYAPMEPVSVPDSAPALVIYTSGSTGRPKGILHARGALEAAVERNAGLLAGIGDVRFGASAPMSFVAFVLEYLSVLSGGGTVHILSDAKRRDIRRLTEYFDAQEISAAFITPQMFRLYKGSRGMKRALVGSERLSGVYSEDFEICNAYGLSETLGGVCSFLVDRKYDNTPIGKPLEGVEIRLLDEAGNAVPKGTEGEICLLGHFADGYLNMPEATAAAFIRQPDGSVLLHTGDIGVLDENSNLVYLNRKDWMVKINGQRVETQEIENLLKKIDGVTNAAVQAFDDHMGQKYLAAFYTASMPVSAAGLTAALKRLLPDYMIPRYYKQLDAMPLNVNGKLDRKALQPPDISDYKCEYTAPENETQTILCRNMEELLGCGRVGIDDDFFSLGGDSIKVLALIEAAKLEALTPDLILRGRTARGISALLDGAEKTDTIEHHTGFESSYPLTEAQMGVYLECVREPESMMYNLPMCCELPEAIDLDRFAAAVKTAFEMHEALGVKLSKTSDGLPCMIPADFTAEPERAAAESLEEAASAFMRPFDLEHDRLFRTELVTVHGKRFFLFDVHHLVFDGSSIKALVNDIAAAYNGEELQHEALSLFDVSIWEKTLKESERYKAAQEYFRNLLDGVDADSRPVSDVTDPAPEKGAGRIVLPLGEIVNSVQAESFVREHGITENTLFLGAFAYTLAKFNGSGDVQFCTVNSGRHDPRLAASVGMFVKTLPVYLQIADEEAVPAFLKRTQEMLFEEIGHDCISFGELAQNYGVSASISFVYQAGLLNGAQTKDGAFEVRPLETGNTQFDLTVMVLKTARGYELSVDYRTELYSRGMMESFADMLAKVASEMLTAGRIGEIEPLPGEATAVLDSFNRTDAPYDAEKTVVDLFREQAERCPDNIAVVYEDKKCSYRELDALTDTLAGNLRACGVGREKVVAVLIPRCEYMVIASLGILKAGAGYLPMDPSYPPERLNLMIKDAGAMLLITTPELSGIISEEFTGRRIMLSEIPQMKACGETLEAPKPADLFIMLYTSGSTGVPKGVMLEHGNLNTFCAWHRKTYGMDENARIAAYASYGFDACMHDIYPALTAGSTIYIISEEMRLNLPALHRYFAENGITHAFMTTQIGRQFAQMENPGKLRLLTAGGEKMVPFAPKDIRTANVYGPTECTIFSTFYEMKRLERDVPIGKALDNMKLYVVDKAGKRLPVGAAGELWIAGPQVGRGYLNRPEQSAAAFTENPFSDDPRYSRVYHTGDIVRFMPDGNVQFIGRRDAQVKVRGFRIELTEVEEVIRRFDGIKDATVAAYDAPSGGKYIAAYVVSDKQVDVDALTAFILAEKPPYMVPAVTMQLDAIPYNQNQKVDRRKLPMPERKSAEEHESSREMTALEQELLDVCAEFVGSRDFGAATKLTDMGLTSISSVQLMVALEKKFGYSPNVAELQGGMRILDIENALVERWRMGSPAQTQPEKTEAVLSAPLTQTQLGIYLECRMDETSDKYNIPFLLKVGHNTDEKRLADAIRAAVEAHPAMKSSIEPSKNGGAEMIAHPDLPWDIAMETSALDDSALEKELSQEKIIFKLSRAPLFRFRIVKNKTALYLSMIFHHILMDGTSAAVLLEDIERAYQGEKLQKESYDSLQLGLDENELRKTDALAKAKAVYEGIFGGVSLNSLPAAEKAADKEGPGKAATAEYALPAVAPENIAAFCKANQITENALFTAAFGLLLARTDGSDEALFASIYNGRTRLETMRIMGMLVKTYPIHVSCDRGANTKDFLLGVQKRIQDLTANDLYSFAEAVHDFDVNADVLFAYQGDTFTGFTLAGQKAAEIARPLEDAKEPLSVDVFKKGGKYIVSFEYRRDMYNDAQMRWMADAYGMILCGLMTRETLGEIPMLSEEAASFLNAANDTDVPVPFRPAHCLMEASAAQFPDRVAVITPTGRVTYKELNESANRIAHALMDLNAVGRIVSLMLPRDERVYMVRQGILKAGGAFLSIAPDYPDDRVRVMVEDSESAVLVVTDQLLSERGDFLASLRCPVVAVEELLRDGRTENPDVPREKDDLAYCIFTSGSTGKPKGVMLTQGNLVNFVDANAKNPEILGYTERGHVSLALAAITFDVSIMEEFIPLSHGLTICMTTEEEIHNPAALAKLMTENHVDVMTCTPSFLTNIIGLPMMKKALEAVVSYDMGAEAYPAALFEKMRAIRSDSYIMNGYGPTEATISCTMDAVTDPGLITIGRPASNVKAYIVDEKGNVLPPLMPGELIIAGEGVGKGYIGRPDLTAEKFFIMEGRPAYHTGDLAAWTSDGRLRFHGRADNQVKLRGLRVELGEIESAINAVPGVLTSIVIMTGEENNKFLAGYYTASREIPAEELRAEIRKTLTAYMVPGVLMQLETMPLTANNKIDKKKLPKVEYTPDAGEYVAPANAVEEDFCGWFAEVLNMEKVSAEGNFFELGGTSLSASIIAINAAEKGYGVVYADVFKAQTPRALAALVTGGAEAEKSPDLAQLQNYDYTKLPLDNNCADKLREIARGPIGNLMLSGAAGFLGMHVLREYLENYDGTAFCLLRGEAPEKRLKELYFYYFDEPIDPFFDAGRVQIVSGDITDVESLKACDALPFDTLVNCAALVKHFVKDDSLERINVKGVENLIDLCRRTRRRFIQTSTVSVAGEGLDGQPPRDWKITENQLYNGQRLDNAYTLSKFKAERAVLEAVGTGLDAKIMRLGNLMGRHSDGEFQVNFNTNAFIRSLASYKSIGAVPYSLMNTVTDFSEIDMTARAILLLAGTDSKFTVFHAVNNHTVTFADIIYSMREYGFRMDTVEDEDFAQRMADAESASGALIAYQSHEGYERRYPLDQDSGFTTNALYRLGFKWPVSGEKYIMSMIKALDELIMFE